MSNSTNLAVKGILAIQAMSQISTLYGEDDDAQHYSVRITELERVTAFAKHLPCSL